MVSILFSLAIVFFIFFSFSRSAYVLTGLTLVWVFYYVNRTKPVTLILVLPSIFCLFFFSQYLDILTFQVSEAAMQFFNKKANNFENDLVETRFYLINIQPILEYFNSFNPIQIILGNGVSVQHSFLSHSLIVSGMLGFLVYLKRFIIAGKIALNSLKEEIAIVDSKFLLLITIVILSNDFITNVSAFLPFSAYLSSIVMAVFFAEIDKIKIQESI